MSAVDDVSPLPSRARRGRSLAADEIERLFVGCERRLGKYLVQMVGDHSLAEDLLQDTFHDALKAPEPVTSANHPTAWLYGIARRKALSALRRRRAYDRAFRRLRRTEPSVSLEEEVALVRDLLERMLSPEDRSLVLLRYLHGFSAVELAEMTGRTPEAIRQRLARARTSLLAGAAENQSARRVR